MTRAAIAATAAVVAATALATPANAGVLTKSATGCADPELTQPFKPWHDSSYYKLVDAGTFEAGTAGWTLTGGAKVVSGNATQKVSGAADSQSLSLPSGSSATTPPVCVGLDEPTLRYFARKNSGLLSTLVVQVQVQLQLGVWVTLPIGVDLGGAWHPSLPHLVHRQPAPAVPAGPDGGAVQVLPDPRRQLADRRRLRGSA